MDEFHALMSQLGMRNYTCAYPFDMLFWFQYYPFHGTKWGGIEDSISTLMRLYEMDGERVLRAVKSGPDVWTKVFEACRSSFTCDEIAMQETGLPEEVQCDLPYAKEFL